MIQQRDAFIQEIYKNLKHNRNIIFLSADFGAPALDALRHDFPDNFYHMGISEQNMIDVAIGLAERGKIVFTYAMAPFASMRCAEQHKIAAMMSLPIINIIAGVGLSYANAGPTHYATEDLALLSSLGGAEVITCSDSDTASTCANYLCARPRFTFVRLDRECSKSFGALSRQSYEDGFRSFFRGSRSLVISHGYAFTQLHREVEMKSALQEEITLVDCFRCKPVSEKLVDFARNFSNIIFVDEQVPNSSLGSILSHNFYTLSKNSKINSYSLSDDYLFANTGRFALNIANGLNFEEILEIACCS